MSGEPQHAPPARRGSKRPREPCAAYVRKELERRAAREADPHHWKADGVPGLLCKAGLSPEEQGRAEFVMQFLVANHEKKAGDPSKKTDKRFALPPRGPGRYACYAAMACAAVGVTDPSTHAGINGAFGVVPRSAKRALEPGVKAVYRDKVGEMASAYLHILKRHAPAWMASFVDDARAPHRPLLDALKYVCSKMDVPERAKPRILALAGELHDVDAVRVALLSHQPHTAAVALLAAAAESALCAGRRFTLERAAAVGKASQVGCLGPATAAAALGGVTAALDDEGIAAELERRFRTERFNASYVLEPGRRDYKAGDDPFENARYFAWLHCSNLADRGLAPWLCGVVNDALEGVVLPSVWRSVAGEREAELDALVNAPVVVRADAASAGASLLAAAAGVALGAGPAAALAARLKEAYPRLDVRWSPDAASLLARRSRALLAGVWSAAFETAAFERARRRGKVPGDLAQAFGLELRAGRLGGPPAAGALEVQRALGALDVEPARARAIAARVGVPLPPAPADEARMDPAAEDALFDALWKLADEDDA